MLTVIMSNKFGLSLEECKKLEFPGKNLHIHALRLSVITNKHIKEIT